MSTFSKLSQRVLFLAPLSLTAVAAAAQQLPVDPVPYAPGDSYGYAAKRLDAAPADLFTRTITGRFNDDAQPDVFVRRRSSAQLFVDPTSWDAALAVPGFIRGMARLTGSATTGRDELLVATPSGLRAWTRDSAGGSFVSRAIGNDLLWGHVELLVAANLDSQFGDDIVGVAPGGGQAMVLMSQAGGTFGPELVFALPAPPLGIVACDFGGVGSKQLVFLGQTSVRVYGYNGLPMLTFAVPGSAVATVLRKGTGVRQRVAWITEGLDGDVLRLLDAQLAGVVPLGDIDATGIARWDFDHDGDDDLAVSHRAGWDLRLLTNVSTAFNVVAQKQLVTGPPGPAASNSAWPAVCDLDGDGDEDVFVPVQANETIFVHLGATFDQRAQMPGLGDPVLFNHGSLGEGQPVGYLQITAEETGPLPGTATHLELVLWRKFDTATPTNPLPMPGYSFLWDARTPVTSHETGLIVYDDPAPSILFWTQRYVELDASGAVVRVFPAAVFAHTTNNRYQDGDELRYLLERGGDVHGETALDPALTHPDHSRSTSTIIRLVPILDFEGGEEPTPDP